MSDSAVIRRLTDHDEKRGGGEECSPSDVAHSELNLIDGPGLRSKYE